MPYQAEISRRSPSAFVLLVDQSGSMSESFGLDQGRSKAAFVADVVNRWLVNLIMRCSKANDVRDYFDVAVLGYGGDIHPAFGGRQARLVPISEVANAPLRVESRRQKVDDGAGGLVEVPVEFPVWVEPRASGHTPMTEVLDSTRDLLDRWLAEHPSSYPPTVVNITDGQPTDGDPRASAKLIRSLASTDGNVLLLNCHISGYGGHPILYPDSVSGMPDPFAEQMFEMSSPLPETILLAAQSQGVKAGARGFAYQADAAALIQFLEIGTRINSLVVVGG